MKEKEWEKLLRIKTTGRDDTRSDTFRYPYEPTSYEVLERLANTGIIGKNNALLDYGCGKGRVSIFMAYQTKCHSIGIEYDERIYKDACNNQDTAVSGSRTEFLLQKAETYSLEKQEDRMFFFNPFSIEILRNVIARIVQSYYAEPRQMLLFFYYPSDEYIAYLMTVDELTFVDEIECMDLFEGNNKRERIMIFEIGNE